MKSYKIILHNVEITFYIEDEFIFKKLTNSPPHIHALPELFIILDGNAKVSYDFGEKEITNKQICIIPKKTYHDVINTNSYKRLAVKFSIRQIDDPSAKNIYPCFHSVINGTEPFVTNFNPLLIKEIFHCLEKEYIFGTEKLKGILTLILIEIAEKLFDESKASEKIEQLKENQNKNLWLAENDIPLYLYSIGKMSTEELSANSLLTPRQISRIVLSEYGYNLLNLKSETRMRRAMFYLNETDMNVSEIAQKLNFSSKESFIICFKKFYGVTPINAKNKLLY